MELIKCKSTLKTIQRWIQKYQYTKVYRYYDLNSNYHKDFKKPVKSDQTVTEPNSEHWFISHFDVPDVVYIFPQVHVKNEGKRTP